MCSDSVTQYFAVEWPGPLDIGLQISKKMFSSTTTKWWENAKITNQCFTQKRTGI
jgi:hypothetical protein